MITKLNRPAIFLAAVLTILPTYGLVLATSTVPPQRTAQQSTPTAGADDRPVVYKAVNESQSKGSKTREAAVRASARAAG